MDSIFSKIGIAAIPLTEKKENKPIIVFKSMDYKERIKLLGLPVGVGQLQKNH